MQVSKKVLEIWKCDDSIKRSSHSEIEISFWNEENTGMRVENEYERNIVLKQQARASSGKKRKARPDQPDRGQAEDGT